MKTLLWTVTAGLALLWSAGAWLMVQFLDLLLGLWPAAGMPSALPTELAWPVWIELWWPRDQLDALLLLVRDVATWMSHWIPSPATWQSLLGVGVWVVWGLGLLMLLALAIAMHWWLGRSRAAPVRAA